MTPEEIIKLFADHRDQIKAALEQGKGTDWGYNGEEEYEFDTFDSERSTDLVVKKLKEILQRHINRNLEIKTDQEYFDAINERNLLLKTINTDGYDLVMHRVECIDKQIAEYELANPEITKQNEGSN